MSELDDIRAFVEIVDAGSLSRAARRLGLSKSIVSRRLARLEANLGGRLLSRTTHGISPTEAGAEFKRRAERILADLEEACGAVAQRGDEVIGLLRIAVPLSFGLRHVAPLLAELARAIRSCVLTRPTPSAPSISSPKASMRQSDSADCRTPA